MNDGYRDRLSAHVQAILDEVERVARIEVRVVVDPARVAREGEVRAPLACFANHQSAEIYTDSEENFPEEAVYHELLHIWRLLVEKVPRLVICEAFDDWSVGLGDAIVELDNAIEHLEIVPKEIHLFPERVRYWSRRVGVALAGLEARDGDDHGVAGQTLGMWLMTVEVVRCRDLIARADAAVDRMGLRARADALREAYLQTRGKGKEAVVRVMFEHLGLNARAACFEYCDSVEGRTREVALV